MSSSWAVILVTELWKRILDELNPLNVLKVFKVAFWFFGSKLAKKHEKFENGSLWKLFMNYEFDDMSSFIYEDLQWKLLLMTLMPLDRFVWCIHGVVEKSCVFHPRRTSRHLLSQRDSTMAFGWICSFFRAQSKCTREYPPLGTFHSVFKVFKAYLLRIYTKLYWKHNGQTREQLSGTGVLDVKSVLGIIKSSLCGFKCR